jgi:cytochrome bd ubiquinol oxidase subunit II
VSLAALIAFLLGGALTAYAVFGGADLGAGILALLAREQEEERDAIAAAIGPVWEANHVWLIFSITILFSAFPAAFGALGTELLAPLTVALLAIVARSVAFGVRDTPGVSGRARGLVGRVFGAASFVAAFAFGAVAGGLVQVSSSPRLGSARIPQVPWSGPFALLIGALAAAICAQLASTFVAVKLVSSRQHRLAERFRARGLQSGTVTFLLSLAAPALAAAAAGGLWHRLVGPALPVVIVGEAAVVVSLLALRRRRYRLARGCTAVTAVALLWGWFIAQAPHLIGRQLTFHAAAATHAALFAIAIASAVVLVLVLPATYALFALFAQPERT